MNKKLKKLIERKTIVDQKIETEIKAISDKWQAIEYITKFCNYNIEPYLTTMFEPFSSWPKHYIIDDVFGNDPRLNRHQTIIYFEYFSEIFENWDLPGKDDKIVILSNRYNSDVVAITKSQLIDIIHDYVFNKRVIGFKFDW